MQPRPPRSLDCLKKQKQDVPNSIMKFHRFSTLLTLVLAALIGRAAAVSDEATALAVLSSGATNEQKAMAIVDLSVTGTAKSVPVLANLLADKELHDYARNALELIPDPSAGAALLASVDKLEGSLRTGVAITLGDRREKAAVPALQKMAGDAKCPAGEAALTSLALIATDEAAGALVTVLKNGPAERKLAAAHAALRAAERIKKEGRSCAALLDAVNAAEVPPCLKKAAESCRKG